jgi:hypothetical protein
VALRTALDAFVAANQNIVSAAQALDIHPNTMRYRLTRVAQVTGRDARNLADLVELIAAERLGHQPPRPLARRTTQITRCPGTDVGRKHGHGQGTIA